MLRRTAVALSVVATAAALTSAPALAAKPAAASHDTVTHGMLVRGAHAAKPSRPTKSNQLTYHGGAVNLTPRVYIVYWGTQWGSGAAPYDPAGEIPLQRAFFNGTDASSWAKSTLQYCSGTSGITTTGATSCSPAATAFTGTILAGTWFDNSAEPAHAGQSDLAGEAQRAAAHAVADGIDISSVQFIIDSPSGNSPSGFGTQYCAWHSSTTYNGNSIAYTNMPYVPDAGKSCGASFVSTSGTLDTDTNEGVTIVGGHEWAETVTDEFPSGGWLDGSGAENGDKCAWISSGQGAAGSVSIGGNNFVAQSLWSNAFNTTGGCVLTS